MKNSLLKLTREWVVNTYSNAEHLVRTEYWVKKIYPKAKYPLLIAALTHDIERAYPKGRTPPTPEFKKAKWDDKSYSQWHGKRSARIVDDFLRNNEANKSLILKVTELVANHEEGGWREADFLKDADSISFLEVNVPLFISKIGKDFGKDEVQEKFDYMFKRITSKKAKLLAKPYYEKAITELNKSV